MDKRTAKREACWLIAREVGNNLDAGDEGLLGEDEFPDRADRDKIEAAMREVLDELARRGHV